MSEQPYLPSERRPIAARNLGIFQRLAERLARWGVSANAISLAGMGCGLAGGLALSLTAEVDGWSGRLLWFAGVLFVQLRLLANLLDGMVAIAAGTASRLGELYNEVPDRISDSAILIGAGYAAGGDVVLGYAAACVALFTAYVRAMGKAAGAPQEFCGPMAKQQRMAVISAVALWCGLTPASWQPSWGLQGAWGLAAAGLAVIVVLGMFTAARRLVRIARKVGRAVQPDAEQRRENG